MGLHTRLLHRPRRLHGLVSRTPRAQSVVSIYRSLFPAAVATAPATLVLGGVGWLVGELWLSSIAETLGRASVQVIVRSPDGASGQLLGVALALAVAAPMALAVRAVITRVSGTGSTLGQWAVALLCILLGTQVGLGGALFNTARVSVPAALDATAGLGTVSVALSDLALANWAFAGAGGAAVIVLAVGIASAGLKPDETPMT